jgi:hypothetical protein
MNPFLSVLFGFYWKNLNDPGDIPEGMDSGFPHIRKQAAENVQGGRPERIPK